MNTREALAVDATPAVGTDPRECPICADSRPVSWMTAPDRFNGRQTQYKLVRCPSCTLVWLQDPPSRLEMGNHYGVDYDRTIAAAANTIDHWLPRRNELSRLKPGGAVLDLGCATGGFLSTLQGPFWKLFGIEMSEDAANAARTRCGAEVFVGDILDAPFAPESFDAITCFNVFEHMYEPRAVLTRIAKWLKAGGIFYTMMPNIDSAAARIFRSYWYALELPRHLYHFSPLTLKKMAEASGLKKVSVAAHRELYFEISMGYVIDDLLRKLGITPKPLARASAPALPWRVVRKGFRLTILPLISAAASLAGDGETITGIFTKDAARV